MQNTWLNVWFRVIETICVVFISAGGLRVVVRDELHPKEDIEDVFLKESIVNSFNQLKSEFLAKVVQKCILMGESSLFSQSVEIDESTASKRRG